MALQELLGDRSGTLGILCRNHRGLVESLAAAARIGADALLLNTGFSAPQLGDVLERENASLVVYDEEFAPLLEEARSRVDGLVEVVAWQDDPDSTPPGRRTRSTYSSSSTSARSRDARRHPGAPCC